MANWYQWLLDRLGSPAGASLAADLLAIDDLVDDLESRLTAVRAGYLDELDFALQEAITALQTDLDNPAQYKADVTTLETRLSAARAGYLDQLDFNLQEAIAAIPTSMVGTNNAALASVLEDAMQKATGPAYNQDTDSQEAIRELLDTIAGYLTTEIADILTDTGTTLPGLLSTIQTDLDNPSQYMANLSTLETRLSAVRAGYLDELAAGNLPTDIATLNTLLGRAVHHMDFWSEVDDLITLNTTAADETLPSVTVAEIPAGATILRVIAIISIGAFEDSSGSENKFVLAGTEHIQVDKSGGTYIDAIKLLNNMWLTGANAIRGGLVMIGDIDVASEVDANDTYEFRIENADVTGNNLLLRDVQVGLRVYFTLG